MTDNYPELSSLATNLHEIVGRITHMAHAATNDELMTTELYEIERILINGDRRLQKLITKANR